MSFKIVFLLLSCWILSVSSYKILIAMSAPVKSHHNLGKAAADILHENGHEVTYVTAFRSSNINYTEIVVPEIVKIKEDMNVGFDMLNKSMIGSLKNFTSVFLPRMVSSFMEDKQVKALENSKFDLVILEYLINEALLGLAVKFDCPAVVISSLPMMTSLNQLSGNIIIPSIVPNILLPFNNYMTFVERAKNFGAFAAEIIINHFLIYPAQVLNYEKYFPKEARKLNFDRISEKIAMVLVNSHPVLNDGRPLFPNAVEIGGYHVGKVEPLPQDLKSLLDNAKDGIIYFSLGSNLQTSTMSDNLRKNILKGLGSLKYPVLWKFEDELKEKPSNVFIRKWMPQTSILAHKNVKIFISHAGLLSTIEATHFGVPTLNIPIFGDQQNNARGAELRGTSLTLDINNVTESSLIWAINEMMENQKYFKAAQNLKGLFNDRPTNPRDALNFYVEHIIRTNGAKHFKPPTLKLYQLLSFDVVFVFIFLPLSLIITIFYYTCRLCKRKLLKRKLKTQ